MQILVLSDSHGKYDAMRDVLLAHGDANMAIHCGDGEQDVIRFLEEFPNKRGWLHTVRGNCDHNETFPTAMTFQLPYGHRAFVIHGHAQMYGDSTGRFVQLAKTQGGRYSALRSFAYSFRSDSQQCAAAESRKHGAAARRSARILRDAGCFVFRCVCSV